MTVELTAGNYRLVLDAARGGAILSADWRNADDETVHLLSPSDASMPPFKAGCFAMLPFANRIADGRFHFQGRDYVLPINNAAENVAIHGFGRENPWRVTGRSADAATLEQDFAADGIPFRYHAALETGLSETGIRVSLSVRNDGEQAMPFGIGLHPWLVKTPQSLLSFQSRGTFTRDARGLPVEPVRTEPAFDTATPQPLGSVPWIDGCFVGWLPRRASLVWPENRAALTIEADGALRHLHVFVPDDRPVVCAEPVSQVPDAANRPALGYPMDVLQPGETLSGTMTLRAMSYPPVRGRDDDPQDL